MSSGSASTALGVVGGSGGRSASTALPVVGGSGGQTASTVELSDLKRLSGLRWTFSFLFRPLTSSIERHLLWDSLWASPRPFLPRLDLLYISGSLRLLVQVSIKCPFWSHLKHFFTFFGSGHMTFTVSVLTGAPVDVSFPRLDLLRLSRLRLFVQVSFRCPTSLHLKHFFTFSGSGHMTSTVSILSGVPVAVVSCCTWLSSTG